jgi:TrmH family RNA methyltransferase
MLNFGIGELWLVNTGEVDEETRNRAVHAQGVLDQARRVGSLLEVKKSFETLVGFAARISTLNKAHRRMSESLPDVARRVEGMGGRVALVFGREDFGLSNEDVEACDLLCTIPTSPSYRSMNLSHAVGVALYEMTRAEHPRVPFVTMASPHEKDVLFATYRHLNFALGFKEHRVDQADMMFRRVVGRAGLSSWEYHRLMGTMSRQLKLLGKWPPPGVGGWQEPADDAQGADASEPRERS